MRCRVVVASLAVTLLAAKDVRADDRYASVDMSVKALDRAVTSRQAGKPRLWRKSRLHRKAYSRATARAALKARMTRKAARKPAQASRRAAPHRAVMIHRPVVAPPREARILPFVPGPRIEITPTAPQVVAPQIVAPQVVAPQVVAPQVVAPQVVAPPPVVAPTAVAAADPEQLAFEAAWNRIADRVNPARLLVPAAEAVGHFVTAVDGATRELVERTIVGLSRRFLIETATVGGTMLRQTPEVSFGRLHPVFARRLAAAIREARAAGMPRVGCFSAYREPGLRVGGMRDKHASLHAYGLACDIAGIGPPGSETAKLWYEIAARHKLYNPYEFMRRHKRQLVHMPAWRHPWEWNHYQPTGIRAILRHDALRRTITAQGPIDLEQMWAVGSRLIDQQPRAQARVVLAGKGKKLRHARAGRGKGLKGRRYASHKRVAAVEVRSQQIRRAPP
jgi:hypothetical protein